MVLLLRMEERYGRIRRRLDVLGLSCRLRFELRLSLLNRVNIRYLPLGRKALGWRVVNDTMVKMGRRALLSSRKVLFRSFWHGNCLHRWYGRVITAW